MSKIKLMDPHLANMIAAGEVVERPSGIVKELVENALDAQASVVSVYIEEGGMGSIKVVDNGEGMDEHDIVQAFQRHSTSKIMQAQDLNHITSFGFRGEALPSIASVSKVTVQTHNGTSGYALIVNNGEKSPVQRIARNPGTTVIVEDLFTKVPARLKYIKNTRYEATLILDILQKFAVAHPQVMFRLVNDDKEVFRTHGTDKLEDVFMSVFGTEVAKDALTIHETNYDFEVSGLLAQPQHTRANKYSIWVFVNNRMIRLPKVQNAVIEGYRRHIPIDRYPIAVIKINVDPQLVDVNVHPSKWEIRLSKEKELIALIVDAIENKLLRRTQVPRVNLEKKYEKQETLMEKLLASKPHYIIEEEKAAPVSSQILTEEKEHYPSSTEEVIEEQEDSTQRLEPLNVLAQMSGKYILAQGEKGLYIIDQHAAMERVRYEYYQNKLLEKKSETKTLLVPMIIEGRAKSVAMIDEVISVLEPFQIVVEAFGNDDLIVREHPTWIKDHELKDFVVTVLDRIEEQKHIRVEDLRRKALATLACHSSVRFNEYLSKEEMTSLVNQLQKCQQPLHCPHGRPTLMLIDHQQLWKEFMR